MPLTFNGHLDLSELDRASDTAVLTEAARKAAEVIADAADRLVPVETGRLKESRTVEAGDASATIKYGTPYAHWVHEGVEFHHPHGGSAKYLEIPMLTEHGAALDAAAEEIRRHL